MPLDYNLIKPLLAFLCSKLTNTFLSYLNPSMSFTSGDIANLPILINSLNKVDLSSISKIIDIYKYDWDNYEVSWNFTRSPLLGSDFNQLSQIYLYLTTIFRNLVDKAIELEEKNNNHFIQAYELSDEFTSEVSRDQISLTCNPYYRYTSNISEFEQNQLLCADTMREFISYAVGCMFGRYSLDKRGLVLANQGETLPDYLRQVPDPTFLPDEDNVIPVLEGDWFNDDITERFKKFLRLTFGAEHYDENLAFIEGAIGRDIRSYFVKEFYKEHLQMYKKRPIYWMFSSPKGSFNVLIYMHRYQPDTLSIILNKYLREFRGKLEARRSSLEQVNNSGSTSQREKTLALKEVEKLKKILAELLDYERETLYPLALEKIAIDLDDGVKVNYAKFGNALAKIPGL